ncbi:unnamed protein product [Linum tenue]|uniref:Uncharacterized protein n=1 Tax=Linum tenue TaxID=586396 RepID=A0AAV0RX80_9ROSI|nr:unnamed protein product [Linum tenue]
MEGQREKQSASIYSSLLSSSSLFAFPTQILAMANDQMKSVASLLLVLNFCMYAVVLGIGGWAMNRAIDHGFLIDFPMGNAATGFFVTFALIAGVVGAASVISGLNHIRAWNSDSLPAAASAGTIAWTLTLLAMGLVSSSVELSLSPLLLQRTMEAFMIILSATQLLYIAAIHGAASLRR